MHIWRDKWIKKVGNGGVQSINGGINAGERKALFI